MALQQLKDTKIPTIYQTGLYNEKNMNVSWEHTDKVLDVLVHGTTECLSNIKSKDYPVAFVFREQNEEFIAAAIIEFFEGKGDEVGNWSYTWTFNESDIPENARKISPYDQEFLSFFRSSAFSKYGMLFDALDNASETEEWGVKLDGVIQFRVVVENGEKLLSAEADGEIKQIVKDDAAIEV